MKLVLFDLDDTLGDERSAMLAAARKLHAKFDPDSVLPVFLEKWLTVASYYYQLYLNGEMSFQEQFRARLREVLQKDIKDDEADRIFSFYYAAYQKNWKIFDDVVSCLNALPSCQLGIITNGVAKQQKEKLFSFGVSDRFSFIVTSEEFGSPKPDPRIFRHACDKAGIKPADAVYIGDRHDVDAVGAMQAGLRGIWLNRLSAEKSVFPNIMTIHSLDALSDILK